MIDLYQTYGIGDSVNMKHIKYGYSTFKPDLNE